MNLWCGDGGELVDVGERVYTAGDVLKGDETAE